MSLTKIKNWVFDKTLYFIVFFLPIIIMYTVYTIFKVYPAGDNSVLVLDLNGQYVYYYEALRDAFWGKSTILYSWSRNLSGEFLGIFGYYLASPFSLIPVILPRTFILSALKIMQLLKLGTAGITFSVFAKNYRKNNNVTIILFAIAYSLASYNIVQLMNPMWLDGAIYLPIIIMGIEKLIDKKTVSLLVISLALMFISNFYIGYMLGIFTCIYLVYFYIIHNNNFTAKGFFEILCKFIISAIIAIMISFIIILPVYKSLEMGKLEFSQPDFTLKSQFTVIAFLTKLLPFSYDTVRPEGLPSIYCSTITIILVPLYFLNSNIKIKQKICNLCLLVTVFMCMYLSPIDIAFHGFQVPNWLPFRYSFVFSFIIIILAMESFNNLKGISLKNIAATLFAIIIFLIYLEDKGTINTDPIKTLLPVFLFSITYSVMLCVKKSKKLPLVSLFFIIILLCEEGLSIYDTIKKIDKDVIYSKYSSYQQYIIDGRDTVNILNQKDKTLFRSEKTFFRTVNDNMAFGLKGVSHSSSTLNSSTINFLNKMGYTASSNFSKYTGHTPVSDSLLAIKYILSQNNAVDNYSYVFTNKNTAVYINENALSIGYMCDTNMNSVKFDEYNPFNNQNILANAMTGNNSDIFIRQLPDFVDYENIEVSHAEDHICFYRTDTNIDSIITYTLTAQSDGTMYMFFPSRYQREMNITINNNTSYNYYENENYYIAEAGNFKKGDKIYVSLKLLKDDLYMYDQYFYFLDQNAFENAITKLKSQQLDIVSYTDTYINAKIKAENNQVMFTSIPFEEGWKVFVDGKNVKPQKLLDTFLGVPLTQGEHEIIIKFRPTYLFVAAIITIIGLALLVLVIIFEHRKIKREKSNG